MAICHSGNYLKKIQPRSIRRYYYWQVEEMNELIESLKIKPIELVMIF